MLETPLSPADLANAVTAFSTLGAGLTTFALGLLVPPRQPRRWLVAYFAIFVTGIPTLGWHGFGTETWRVLDVGTNLLLGFALQLAVLGDYYGPATRLRVAAASAFANAAALLQLILEGVKGEKSYLVSFGEHGGFYAGEAMLIADALLVTVLLVAKRREFPDPARPMLWIATALFVAGLVLATADGDVVTGRFGAWHALWHVVGGFGFVFLWAFNHVRLTNAAGGTPRYISTAS